ncbi:MAG: hypothetical protein NTX09_02105 [Verrucomicrobia bacterium]|nr:hypothetical protein [Verrucomicrobiota bacterium]
MLKCNFCNRDEKSKMSKAQHETYCKSNPEGQLRKPSFGMLGKKGSNQFIKGTANPMTEEGREKIRQKNRDRIWTEEDRQQHSASMKKAVDNNPEAYSSSNRGRVKQIEYDGIKFQGNWELDFYKWCVSNNILCERNTNGFKYEWNGTRTYFPDLLNPRAGTPGLRFGKDHKSPDGGLKQRVRWERSYPARAGGLAEAGTRSRARPVRNHETFASETNHRVRSAVARLVRGGIRVLPGFGN